MGVDLDLVTMDELVSTVTEEWPPGARAVIAHQNLHGVYLSHRDPGMRQLAARARLVHIDGMALVYLARLLGHPARPEHRSTYMDLVWPLLAACEARGRRVFYLGGRPGVAEEALKHAAKGQAPGGAPRH